MKTSRYKQALALLICSISTDFLYATEHSDVCNVVESIVCEKVITVADANSPDIPYNFKIDNIHDKEHTDDTLKERHFCEIHEENAKVNGFARGTRIELIDVPDSFQNEMVDHVRAGYTELIISNGMLCGSKLKISDVVKTDIEQVVIDQLNQDIQQTSVTTNDLLSQVHSAMRWEKPNAFQVSVKADRFLQDDSSTCFDDPDFWFIRDNNLNSTCAWLTIETERQDARIARYCDRPHVKYACPHTCLELRELPCECPSNTPNFEFVMLNVVPERNQTCSWITKNSKQVETRRENYCYSDYRKVPVEGDESVGENCINSCFCTGGFRTAAPSISPSDLPTFTPSVRPSITPSSFPSSTCSDDPDFWFIRDNNLNSTCAWLTSDTDRQDIRIGKYCDRPHVKYACPHTCLELQDLPCECPSNTPNFEFVMLNVVPERNQTCSWITRNGKQVETRRENYCYSDYRKVPVEGEESVGENCIDSCFCTGGFRSSSPSLAPSDVPTKTPTMSPSKTPSANPSELPTLSPSVSPTAGPSITPSSFPSSTCSDDPDFWFIRDNNLNSTCAWLTSDTDRQDIRIGKYCDRPHVKYACPHTCLELQDLPCECPSNTPNFEFVMLNVVPERNQTCSWITRNGKQVETRRENYCYSDYRKVPVEGEESVGENCIDSCFCTGGFRSSSPSLAPSDVPTKTPTMSPSKTPSANPTDDPTVSPSSSPSGVPSKKPSMSPSKTPSANPTDEPSVSPSSSPSVVPTKTPSMSPSMTPSASPSEEPTVFPTSIPSVVPTKTPSTSPSKTPSTNPTDEPSVSPSSSPSVVPTNTPSMSPSMTPSASPSEEPTVFPTSIPSVVPTKTPSMSPSKTPSMSPSKTPSANPTDKPSVSPSSSPSDVPTKTPSMSPSIEGPSSTKAPTFTPSSTKAPVAPSSTKAPTFTPSSTKAPVAPSSTKAPTFTHSSTKAPVAPSSTKAPVTSSTKAPTFSPTSSTKAPISVDRMSHHSYASASLSGEQKVISDSTGNSNSKESSASTNTAAKRLIVKILKRFK